MNRKHAILERLSMVVERLGDLADEFVFVGGSVVPLLVTDEASPDCRPTIDVDVIVHVLRRHDYYALTERLAKIGFAIQMGEDVICRFRSGELILDVMPTREDILTFSSRWYEPAINNFVFYELPGAKKIKVISAPLFLCTKFEAYHSRGKSDEKDLEDIIFVVNGRLELLDDISTAEDIVKQHLRECVQALLDNDFASRIDFYLPNDRASAARALLVLERLEAIARSEFQ